ncbi:Zinc finger FYVE domain-containing protein 26 [Mortierella hygrophila]|uniref:Zinc finger FYVE domain-containing protein 26 n=1 Tax=Mortierella hygrophila TaxID=979708 RepID=A0A9P6F6H5_9FUNG|nr:Zinc finger FYVE domain-containing protein 26 [Mortierella hygrophila]
MSISTKAIFTTTTTTTTSNNDDQHSSSSVSVSSPSSSDSPSSLSPVSPATEMMHTGLDALPAAAMIATPPPVDDNNDVVTPCAQLVNNTKDEAPSSDTETLEAGVTATLHKKDSGTSMGTSVVSSPIDSRPPSQTAHQAADNNSYPTSPTEPAPVPTTTTTGTRRFSQSDTPSMMSPAGRVLTRPLSTSKLSSIPLTAPHILPNQRYAGFNLAAFGQLSPSSSTAAAMTISRADSLAFLNSNSSAGSSPNPYFGISAAVGGSGGASTPNSLMEGIMLPSSSGVTRTTMCGSDAISLLDLDDSHNDIVMIDSNGNSSGSAVVGPATVVETMASASAIVSNNHASASHHHTLGGAASGLVAGLGGLTTAVSSASLLTGGGGLGGSGGGGSGATSVLGGGSAFGTGSSSGSNISQPRSSLPSLTSQAKKDVMQRAAMLAAMQQNGGAKILGAHRVGRRQDRPNRKIRFGDYHKICEIEYGFDQGKPLVANGRTLVHSTVVLRICGDEEREEQLYLFSDVLVTGTKIRKEKPKSEKSTNEVPANVATAEEVEKADDVSADDRQQGLVASVEESKVEMVAIGPEVKAEMTTVEVSIKETLLDNPYAGHLENQQISRLTQVQADVVEGDERPMLKVSMPQSTSLLIFESTATRDIFTSLLAETTYAHKHYLLSQSKYLADLKKFKRHSAFSFDTSFLKTWGIPGGLNLGSLKPAGGSGGHGVIGPNTFTSSPVTSPGGSAFDPYQHQQHLNRPQSMAGSLFGFALNGGPFQPFSGHSKESSYATLRGANAAHALQYHHQHQQMLQQQLQNRLSMSSLASGRAGGMDRTSSGSTFDALWFMKSGETVKSSRRSVVHAAAENENDRPAEEDLPANVVSGEPTTTATQPSSSSSAGSPSLTVNTGLAAATAGSSSVPSHPPLSTSSSFNSTATLRNGAGWVRDEDATYCMVCTTTKFGVLIRKHHCRLCGRVICWKCCQMKDAVLLNNEQGFSPTEAAALSQDFRKPIRVCLDCIEQNATASQEGNSNQTSQPSSPQQQSISFPLQGVLGKLMSSTMTSSPQIEASPTNATGSSTFGMPQMASVQAPLQQRAQGSTPSSFYPRIMSYGRNGNPYPHHHRASLYRIDVERVGEEDEEEEEEEEEEEQEVAELLQKADEALESLALPQPEPSSQEDPATANSDTNNLTVKDDSNTIIKSRHGSVRLKDLDPADINEEEVQNQIMNLESEVESLLIQSAAAPLMFARTGGGSAHSRHQREGGTGAGKTRVIRGIPKEMMLQYGGGGDGEGEDGQDEEDEEVSMEELLAQQDEQLKRILS